MHSFVSNMKYIQILAKEPKGRILMFTIGLWDEGNYFCYAPNESLEHFLLECFPFCDENKVVGD